MPDEKDNDEPDLLAKAVAARIQELMTKGGITQAELAARLKVKPAYVWRVVEGRQNLSLRLLGRISLALGVTLAKLFAGIAVPPEIAGSRPYVLKPKKPKAG